LFNSEGDTVAFVDLFVVALRERGIMDENILTTRIGCYESDYLPSSAGTKKTRRSAG
jgi:hypothetical protein